MGMIDRFIGVGSTVTAVSNAATGVASMLAPNATRQIELDAEGYAQAISQHQAEFQARSGGWWDAAMNGLNRLPRPLLTLGTIGLFIYAMVEPIGFSQRMEGLALVPEPLWWLMGAIVSFYFGAREAYYFRRRTPMTKAAPRSAASVDDGWRAPIIPMDSAPFDEDEGWVAPIIPTEPAPEQTSVATPVAAPMAAPVSAEAYADNAALRDWVASRTR